MLYQKYRPSTLEAVKGNADIVAALEGMLSKPETCPHVFLLHGGTGMGKTTIARIIAAAVNCPERKDGEPCSSCGGSGTCGLCGGSGIHRYDDDAGCFNCENNKTHV